MNTTKPTTRVKLSFCRCGAQFQVETRGQKSCPDCIEAKRIAEANKPPTICRHCGEARNDCKHRICPDCKAAKEQEKEAAQAAKKPRKCRTCGELSLTVSMSMCDPCREVKRKLWQGESEQRQEEYEPETDPTILATYAMISILLEAITDRREELRLAAIAAVEELPLEDQPHTDQASIDAAFRALLDGIDF